jgi:uncharacterized protein
MENDANPIMTELDARYDIPKAGRRFHAMAKPSGSQCNLDCTYCYYLDKETLLEQPRTPRMSPQVLEAYVRQYLRAHAGSSEVVFTWQGGEPTLLGIPFFQRAVALQKQYARAGQKVSNDLQTNGTLLDEAWAKFLKANGFLVGLSIDGPRELHDRYRLDKGGRPTFDKVWAASRLLKRHGIPHNALACVNRETAKHPLLVYRFLVDEFGADRVQFTPVVEPRAFATTAPGLHSDPPLVDEARARPGATDSVVTDWSVDPLDWGEFLVAVFDEWDAKDRGTVFVNWFESMVSWRIGLDSQMCVTSEFCGRNLAVEHDGAVYSCDHFVYPEHDQGNILRADLGDIAFTRRQVKFGMDKKDTLPGQCKTCPHLEDCWGECPRNRLVRTPDGEPGLNYLCRGFQRFYGHASKRVDQIAREVRI